MKHLGDITKIDGYTVPIVDCVIGGSPCQDLSVAGKRKGLEGERSGLFMEQIRLVKEMREHDKANGKSGVDIRPRYMVWENVPGALSSGNPKGEDFRIVLEEIARIKDKDAVIPRPTEGKWTTSGCIMADGWSIAWRILDAQFWGVPQRRRRIALVADFGDQSASEILFVRKSLSRDSEPSQEERKDSSNNTGTSTITNDCERAISFQERAGCRGGGKGILVQDDHVGCLSTLQNQFVCYDARENGNGYTVPTLTGDHENRVTDYTGIVASTSYCIGNGQLHDAMTPSKELSKTLNCMDDTMKIVVEMDRAAYNQVQNAKFDMGIGENGIAHTCIAKGPGAVAYEDVKAVDLRNDGESDINGSLQADACRNLQSNNVVRINYVVRRLTPLECERLQGFPCGWTDIGDYVDSKGKKCKTSDANRYKSLGNSIALPQWKWCIKRLCSHYERNATMASLFDGISGFVAIWTQLNGRDSVKWTSEIEEFPIAVSKRHFGDESTGERGDYEKFF